MLAIRNLTVIIYANGSTLWHYKSVKDTVETTCVPDYFNDARDMLAAGDAIIISALDGGAMRHVATADLSGVVLAKML